MQRDKAPKSSVELCHGHGSCNAFSRDIAQEEVDRLAQLCGKEYVAVITTDRAYGIASSPNQVAYYEITVRRIEKGLVSGFLLDKVKKGDELEISGPAGNFYFNPLIHVLYYLLATL